MPKAVLITSHFYNSRRKAGFHHIADSLMKRGYEVLFLTGDVSYFRFMRKDYRNNAASKTEYNKFVRRNEKLSEFIRFTYLHPVNLKNDMLNNIALPFVKNYSDKLDGFDEVNDFIKKSELIIFESFNGLLWFDHIKKLNGKAKLVYRVSDDIRQLRKHFYLIEQENKIYKKFDLVSVPSEFIFNIFTGGNVKLQNHGIRKDLFDKEFENPYSNDANMNFVFTGNAYLDKNFLEIAGKTGGNKFHIIGPFNGIDTENVKYYGEMNFESTVPYIKYADAGLHILDQSERSQAFTDSLKVIQYTYCRLPIIVPESIKSSRENFIYYKAGDALSILNAIEAVKKFDRNKIDTGNIKSWDEVTENLINE